MANDFMYGVPSRHTHGENRDKCVISDFRDVYEFKKDRMISRSQKKSILPVKTDGM